MDANGNLTAMSDRAGTSSWGYDENNQPISESRTQVNATRTAQYSYYPNGLLHTLTTFNTQTVTFGYDAALRLSSQTDPIAGGTIQYGYDSRSRRTAITFPSGVAQRVSYDQGGRVDLVTLTKADGTELQRFDYEYGIDANGARVVDYHNGLVTRVTESDAFVVRYGYDELDRLSGAVRSGTNPFDQTYGYNRNNNRISVRDNLTGSTTPATYDDANQLTNLGSTSYGYDRNGNLAAFGNNSLTYDAANKWESGTIDGQTISFRYDGLGRRAWRTLGASARTYYWYDQTGLTRETGTTSATHLRAPDGTLLSIRLGSNELHNVASDRLGSITGLVTRSGGLANSYTYDPWGQPLAASGTAYTPYRFAGTYLDDSTGLYLMGQRYYQPSSGRFTQLDPLPTSLLSINRYAYADCNPVNFTDPMGLTPCYYPNGAFGYSCTSTGGIAQEGPLGAGVIGQCAYAGIIVGGITAIGSAAAGLGVAALVTEATATSSPLVGAVGGGIEGAVVGCLTSIAYNLGIVPF